MKYLETQAETDTKTDLEPLSLQILVCFACEGMNVCAHTNVYVCPCTRICFNAKPDSLFLALVKKPTIKKLKIK